MGCKTVIMSFMLNFTPDLSAVFLGYYDAVYSRNPLKPARVRFIYPGDTLEIERISLECIYCRGVNGKMHAILFGIQAVIQKKLKTFILFYPLCVGLSHMIPLK